MIRKVEQKMYKNNGMELLMFTEFSLIFLIKKRNKIFITELIF